eukprot:Nk52_evm66s2367 gene=Nk52_evmTU66s2367
MLWTQTAVKRWVVGVPCLEHKLRLWSLALPQQRWIAFLSGEQRVSRDGEREVGRDGLRTNRFGRVFKCRTKWGREGADYIDQFCKKLEGLDRLYEDGEQIGGSSFAPSGLTWKSKLRSLVPVHTVNELLDNLSESVKPIRGQDYSCYSLLEALTEIGNDERTGAIKIEDVFHLSHVNSSDIFSNANATVLPGNCIDAKPSCFNDLNTLKSIIGPQKRFDIEFGGTYNHSKGGSGSVSVGTQGVGERFIKLPVSFGLYSQLCLESKLLSNTLCSLVGSRSSGLIDDKFKFSDRAAKVCSSKVAELHREELNDLLVNLYPLYLHLYSERNTSDVNAYLAQNELPETVRKILFPSRSKELKNASKKKFIENFWVGPEGSISPCHKDPYNNFLCQLSGAKYVRLYAPENQSSLYPYRMRTRKNTSSIDIMTYYGDLKMSDGSLRYPQAGKAPYMECILQPGDVLFIPKHHWHYVHSLSYSVSANFWWT